VDTGGQESLPLPHDLMHILSTIMKTVFTLLVSPMSASEKASLDLAVSEIMGPIRSGEKHEMPRMFFSNGITSVTMLTAGEWVGVMLMTTVLLNTKRGRATMSECMARARARERASVNNQDTAEIRTKYDNNGDIIELPPLDEITVDDVIEVIEEILLFHAYTSYGNTIRAEDGTQDNDCILSWKGKFSEGRLHQRITFLQTIIVVKFPRRSGCGWRIQKFHELIHIPRQITLYGFPYNFDTGYGERLLKPYGKGPSKTVRSAHTHEHTYDVACRVYDEMVIVRVMALSGMSSTHDMRTYEEEESEKRIAGGGSWELNQGAQWKLVVDEKKQIVSCTSARKGNGRRVVGLPQLVVERLVETISEGLDTANDSGTALYGYTEIFIKDDRDGLPRRLRCNPSYRGAPWYEWCLCDYRDYYGGSVGRNDTYHNHAAAVAGYPGTTPPGHFPSKVLAIIANPLFVKEQPEHPFTNPRILCLVHMTKQMTTESKLTEQWQLEYENKEISIPAADENGNILGEGFRLTTVQVPTLRLVHPHYLKRRIYVVEEFPKVRSFIDPGDYDSHSDIVVYVRDRKRYWTHIYAHCDHYS
jgi:hypothetical protein